MGDINLRVDRLESESSIRRLVAEYCHGADKRDIDRFLSVWTPDAVWQMSADVSFRGKDAIERVVRAQWRAFAQYVHWTTNVSLVVSGDTADGECDVAVLVRLHNGRWIRSGGTYRDRYRRLDGTWFIAHRDASIGFDIDLPAEASEVPERFDSL
ncbi:nuclear transport factor 2 family protein [Microbacterium sp. NPDC077184]|uniref:nuclear transport factor 2 family protein n=1 Tax=Microbacterium sp. NPDC077184 TaxID=3154764 RepID=UPI0034196E14